jgi:4-amino-4-deoxy-L-arabinose transferase-like glycosyltransferase
MGRKVTDYLLYRWRYILGYGVISLIVIGLLFVAGLLIPGALSQAELNSVVTSSQPLTSFDPSFIINLPYHLLQRGSLHIFGVTTFSIKLPSMILGLASIIGMFILLRAWFRHNVAILTTLLIITTGQFLYLSQSGTPGIVYIFWSVWLLVSALMISRRAPLGWLWKIILAGIIALSLYTPLSTYILLALLSAVLLHPHLRYIVRKLPKVKMTIAIVVGLILITPLIYTVWHHPETGRTLLGFPDTQFMITDHVRQALGQYIDFWSEANTPYLRPLYGIGTLALILLGIMRLFTAKYTARSYIITAWSLLLIPIIVINPDSVSITFVPALLLTAMGVASLLHMWYSLFPRNPYARIVGVVPLIVLMGGMLLSGVDRYIYAYTYNATLAKQFSRDLQLFNEQLPANNGPITLVTSANEAPFYQTVARYHPGIMVATALPETLPAVTVVSRVAHQPNDPAPTKIITDSKTEAANRFYVYKSSQK